MLPADVEDAFLWYESQRPGLGEEYLEEIALVLRAIVDEPKPVFSHSS